MEEFLDEWRASRVSGDADSVVARHMTDDPELNGMILFYLDILETSALLFEGGLVSDDRFNKEPHYDILG